MSANPLLTPYFVTKMAEREGFEPPVPAMGTADFESAAFDLSAISRHYQPVYKFIYMYKNSAVGSRGARVQGSSRDVRHQPRRF